MDKTKKMWKIDEKEEKEMYICNKIHNNFFFVLSCDKNKGIALNQPR